MIALANLGVDVAIFALLVVWFYRDQFRTEAQPKPRPLFLPPLPYRGRLRPYSSQR